MGVLNLLLEKGADPNIQPFDKENSLSPLFKAAVNNQPEVCELLLRFGANIDKKFHGLTALEAATRLKHTKVIKILQAATAKKNDERRKEIIANIAKAKTGQDKEKLEEMTKMYKDLFGKAKAGYITAFQRMQNLPKHQFDINWANNEYGQFFLMVASGNGHANLVSYLLDNGAIVDTLDKLGGDSSLCSCRSESCGSP